jgi:hypothetical protein
MKTAPVKTQEALVSILWELVRDIHGTTTYATGGHEDFRELLADNVGRPAVRKALEKIMAIFGYGSREERSEKASGEPVLFEMPEIDVHLVREAYNHVVYALEKISRLEINHARTNISEAQDKLAAFLKWADTTKKKENKG